ncbi:hypothetical protein KY334_07520, partial [Candidatus Woesearchaeota archaeon]|nr:hypothetical protein [Candidatus Woesearchaeota archaeon]
MQRELKIMLTTSALINLAGGMLGPIYAIFVQDIGGAILTAGSSYSIFAIVAGIMTFFVAKLEDRYDHQEFLIVIGYFIMCLG